ncbi:hypothetical protein [Oerskovia enterophila]|uniref:hypothetical protein n=1 Tax=Oerskovia enterophila TaxID=43678 RepID=UPI00083890AC|nr:hypothetical protein [Oerskovia enterophila]
MHELALVGVDEHQAAGSRILLPHVEREDAQRELLDLVGELVPLLLRDRAAIALLGFPAGRLGEGEVSLGRRLGVQGEARLGAGILGELAAGGRSRLDSGGVQVAVEGAHDR